MKKGLFWHWLPQMKYALLLVWLVPIAALALFGSIWLWQHQYWWPFIIAISILSLLTFLVNKGLTAFSENLQQPIKDADSSWGEKEQQIWQQLVLQLNEQPEPEWSALYRSATQQFRIVADYYYPENSSAAFAFTIPEALQINEEVSRRYRQLVKTHLPLADQIRIDQIINAYQYKGQLQTQLRWAKTGYRIARFVNPLNALLAEVRGYLVGNVVDETSRHLQYKAKRLLLEQAGSVAIDLYSGRWRPDNSLSPLGAEPIGTPKVAVLGQINAGKSSLINQIMGQTVAEHDALPATDEVQAYSINYDDENRLMLLDHPGTTMAGLAQAVKSATDADVIVWVIKATQPARKVDVSFLRALRDFYVTHKERRMPPVIVVITHIDLLGPSEPLDSLNFSHPESTKAEMVVDLVTYLKQTLPFADETWWIPVCTQSPEQFNIDTVEGALIERLDEANLVQMNRRRYGRNQLSFRQEWQKAKALGKVVFKQVWADEKKD
ncbi:GTPase family protein [Thaumasiovibrio sp. DFM-14]|uniref:GTPase family protein n=1 Tax=Thaumasiovibrio sp. DFM-14 TaxID=3384792 RepID=UPI0039A0FE6B